MEGGSVSRLTTCSGTLHFLHGVISVTLLLYFFYCFILFLYYYLYIRVDFWGWNMIICIRFCSSCHLVDELGTLVFRVLFKLTTIIGQRLVFIG